MTKKEVPLTKEKEIYKTEYINKELSTVSYCNKHVRSSLDWDETTVCVSDATAKGAFDVFQKIMSEIKEDG